MGNASCLECARVIRDGLERTALNASQERTAFTGAASTDLSSASATVDLWENPATNLSAKSAATKLGAIVQLRKRVCARKDGKVPTAHSAFPTGTVSTETASTLGSATASTDFLDQLAMTLKTEMATGVNGDHGPTAA